MLVAAISNEASLKKVSVGKRKKYNKDIRQVKNLWDIFLLNSEALSADFKILTRGRKSQKAGKTNQVLGEKNIFIEKGAKVNCSILNAALPAGGASRGGSQVRYLSDQRTIRSRTCSTVIRSIRSGRFSIEIG
jgi:hypothetical protein